MKYIFSIILFSVIVSSCNFSSNVSSNAGDIKKVTQGDIERISPLKYLELKSDYMIANNYKVIIDGEVYNSASIAKYKDVIVQVFCLNGEGEIIKREKIIAVDNILPNTNIRFKLLVKAADSTRKVIVKLYDATGLK